MLEKKDLDHDVLKSFLCVEDQKNFIAFENVILRSPSYDSIHLSYRCPFPKYKFIQISDYLKMVREQKLKGILE